MEERTGTESPGDTEGPTRAESRAERLARREQTRRQQKAANWRRKWLPWVIVGGIAALVLAGVFLKVITSPMVQPIEGVERFADLSRAHAPGPQTYPQVPPVGGPHAGVWQTCCI